MKLKEFVRDIGGGTMQKGRFPYEYININNYATELDKQEPFPREAFDNKLKNKSLNEAKHQEYLIEAAKYATRWDYLSMSQCANAIKYSSAYVDFEMNGNYNVEDTDKPINITMPYWRAKVESYFVQDLKKNRDISNNVTFEDYEYFKEIFENQRCYICHSKFFWKNRPTLHRIDNELSHSKDNVFPCLTTFSKHDKFNGFVKDFMQQRAEAKSQKNDGLATFCKLILNSAFGGDILNSEKYSNIRLYDDDHTFQSHLFGSHYHDIEIADNLHAVQVDSEYCRCNNCLQVGYFTLDSAKYFYINFIYNFLYKAFDQTKMHTVQLDTDSLTLAISGDKNRGPEQRFDAIIKDQEFYDKNKGFFFSEGNQRKILGVHFEKQGLNCIALSPKNYIINDECGDVSLVAKGVILRQNPQINEQTFIDNIKEGKVMRVTNTILAQKNKIMSKLSMTKNGISGSLTKMLVLENQSCAPYINGLKAKDYQIKQ
ncbi:MAG: hypothetical protein EZS28_009679 [Streblomastix strix]|uniref:DNA-directed DNA polymerase n=1 Tax=Streblomastix strix TaxID=222440 RepID=A0A5J4WIY2_9EUKA|nr:MAG: hypothetical protein EZS28_009679 [Streblomastix strix]